MAIPLTSNGMFSRRGRAYLVPFRLTRSGNLTE
jgi:hypothetical protein